MAKEDTTFKVNKPEKCTVQATNIVETDLKKALENHAKQEYRSDKSDKIDKALRLIGKQNITNQNLTK